MSLVCLFGCVTLMGCKNKIVKKLAYFPPSPAGYHIVTKENKNELLLQDENGNTTAPVLFGTEIRSFWLKTRRRQTIPAILVSTQGAHFTIIFSHGNSADIGIMTAHLIDFAIQLNVNVFMYEYTGYGLSTGTPSEKDTYADIRAAYSYVTTELGLPPSQIIIYGQSVGSGPSVDLASDKKCPVRALILHSAIASGLRMLKAIRKSPWFDLYPNVEKMGHIKVPVLLIHGTHDREVPLEHSLKLQSACKSSVQAFWVPEADHNNIELCWREEYFEKLQEFIESLLVSNGVQTPPQAVLSPASPIPTSRS
eukprot:GILK01008668.1.p1 GENE.GILK01008668.1~~GILK01008668.1.p1  ORF type:complete len:309 (-),score=25.00 GILK01008668.1:149-1075(-)